MSFYSLQKNKRLMSRGFTVLFAVIVSSLIIAIGLSIGNITLKQIRISSLGRDSQIAFYAADSGAECVMFHDLINQAFATSSDSSGMAGEIDCFGERVAVIFNPDDPDDADSEHATSTINIRDTTPGNSLCALVEIGKHDTNNDGYSDRTIILSRGYNICSNGANNKLLERGVRIRY